MILKIKHRASYYRRFHLDIWGLLRTTVFYKPFPVEPAMSEWEAYYRHRPAQRSLAFRRLQER